MDHKVRQAHPKSLLIHGLVVQRDFWVVENLLCYSTLLLLQKVRNQQKLKYWNRNVL